MNKDIIIKKFNSFSMYVLADDSTTETIYEYFKFKDPSFNDNPFRKSKWDGFVRLYDKKTRKLPIGLLYFMLKFCVDRGYTFSLDPELKIQTDRKPIEDWLNAQIITNEKGEQIEPHWYQRDIFLDTLEKHRKTALAATSAGKSLIVYLLGKYWVENIPNSGKMLVLVSSIGLVNQLFQDFNDYSQINKFDVDGNVHLISGGKDKNTEKKIVISTWQSLEKLTKENPKYFQQFGFFIGDECHEAKGASIQSIGKALVNAEYRLGMTGTLDDMKMHRLQIQSIFGKVKKYVQLKQLQDEGKSANTKIFVCKLTYDDSERVFVYKERKKVEKLRKIIGTNSKKATAFMNEVDYLINHPGRNQIICNMANNTKGNTMVLFNYVDKHGIQLYEKLKKESNKKIFIIHGGIKGEEREQIRNQMETEENCILLASYGTCQKGINIKNIHNIIFASPSKSKIRVLQSLGRGVRLHIDKDYLRLYDISDDLTWKKKPNFTLTHLSNRIEYYEKEQQHYKIINIAVPKHDIVQTNLNCV